MTDPSPVNSGGGGPRNGIRRDGAAEGGAAEGGAADSTGEGDGSSLIGVRLLGGGDDDDGGDGDDTDVGDTSVTVTGKSSSTSRDRETTTGGGDWTMAGVVGGVFMAAKSSKRDSMKGVNWLDRGGARIKVILEDRARLQGFIVRGVPCPRGRSDF